jgi:hypothetical protein
LHTSKIFKCDKTKEDVMDGTCITNCREVIFIQYNGLEGDDLHYLIVDEMVLEWILGNYNGQVWTEFTWPGIETRGQPL